MWSSVRLSRPSPQVRRLLAEVVRLKRHAMLSLEQVRFRYDPFPIAVAPSIFPADVYREMLANWPPLEMFQGHSTRNVKYSLAEVFNPAKFFEFVAAHRVWRDLYTYVKDGELIRHVLRTLEAHHVDLGLKDYPIRSVHRFSPLSRRLRFAVSDWMRGRKQGRPLRARFEFSMLPGRGGVVLPHTDAANKIITLVLSMVDEGEWRREWGGGTCVLKAKDPTRNFNHMNRTIGFEECETLEVFDFQPNQAVLFVKTFNSWHGVHPMNAPQDGAWRKTLTINIEK